MLRVRSQFASTGHSKLNVCIGNYNVAAFSTFNCSIFYFPNPKLCSNKSVAVPLELVRLIG